MTRICGSEILVAGSERNVMSAAATARFVRHYSQLLIRAWCDEGFDQLLEDDSRAAVASVGLHVPPDAEIVIRRKLESPPDLPTQLALWADAAASRRYVLLVPPLDAQTLSANELDHVVGGSAVPGVSDWRHLLRDLLHAAPGTAG
jgi:hypothetical protein